MSLPLHNLLIPHWPAPPSVRAVCTTRTGVLTASGQLLCGVSTGDYASLNLGDHVGDEAQAVAENRRRLNAAINTRPVFLQQVHGVDCIALNAQTPDASVADAATTAHSGIACTVMVADCLPLLFSNRAGTRVAAAHAGWRGLAGGVIESTLRAFEPARQEKCAGAAIENIANIDQPLNDVMVWLGPCIGPSAFEVGEEVRATFTARYGAAAQTHLVATSTSGKWLCNLSGLARMVLQQQGIRHLYGNDGSAAWCTYSNSAQWFSHRRASQQGKQSGRFAACIWLQD